MFCVDIIWSNVCSPLTSGIWYFIFQQWPKGLSTLEFTEGMFSTPGSACFGGISSLTTRGRCYAVLVKPVAVFLKFMLSWTHVLRTHSTTVTRPSPHIGTVHVTITRPKTNWVFRLTWWLVQALCKVSPAATELGNLLTWWFWLCFWHIYVVRLRPVPYFPDMSGWTSGPIFFRERSDFFRTSIVERLVVIL